MYEIIEEREIVRKRGIIEERETVKKRGIIEERVRERQ